MIMAVIIAMFIIWLFFGDIKASLIVGTSHPGINFSGPHPHEDHGLYVKRHHPVESGPRVGMMVDNSIVVLESCFRFTDKGGGFVETRKAAIDGTAAVLESIIGGTVTTCCRIYPVSSDLRNERTDVQAVRFTIVFCMIAS